jgi:chromate transporter
LTQSTDKPDPPARPTVSQLFWASAQVGVFSIGGGLSGWLHREFVVRRGWMDDQTFYVDQALARALPGTNISNFMAIAGYKLIGIAGSAAAILGIVSLPLGIILVIGAVYEHLNSPLIENALSGAAAGALGLIVPVAWNGIRHLGWRWVPQSVWAATTFAVVVLNLPMVWVVALTFPVSVLLAMRKR